MLIKIIKCEVNEDSRDIFHLAQTKWTELNLARGFVTQLGGWNLLNKEEAVIIGVWESLDAYTLFMNKNHDKILDTNGQLKTYRKIEVSLWSTDENINSTNINYFKFSTLIDVGDYKINNNEKGKAIFMTQIKNEKSRKVLIFNSELGGNIGDFETVIKLDKEWAV